MLLCKLFALKPISLNNFVVIFFLIEHNKFGINFRDFFRVVVRMEINRFGQLILQCYKEMEASKKKVK